MLKPVIFAAVFSSLSAHAAGTLSIKISQDASNNSTFTLSGTELCPAGAVRVSTTHRSESKGPTTVTTTPYKLRNGKDKFEIKGDCTIDLPLKDFVNANDLLEATIITYNGAQADTVEKRFLRIPCLGNIERFSKRGEILKFAPLQSKTLDSQFPTVCVNEDQMTPPLPGNGRRLIQEFPPQNNGPRPLPAYPPTTGPSPHLDVQGIVPGQQQGGEKTQEPQQSCELIAKIDSNISTVVNVSLKCQLQDTVTIWLVDSQNKVLYRGQPTFTQANAENIVVNIPRSPERTLKFTGTLTSPLIKGEIEALKTIPKDPTHLYKQTGQYQMSSLDLTPTQQSKSALNPLNKGFFWSAEIKVVVADQDIEPEFPQQEIIVELLNESNGVVRSVKASTGEVVSFNVEAQFLIPRFLGSSKWDTGKEMRNGDNVFKVRVYDAYSNDVEKAITLEPIHVHVNGDDMK